MGYIPWGHKAESEMTEQITLHTFMLLLLLSHFSRVRLFAIPSTIAYQALPSMGFFKQEYWSGLPFPPPVDLPD